MFRPRDPLPHRRAPSCAKVTAPAALAGASARASADCEIEFHVERPFFTNPILNSPYECPSRHWELDASGQPTGQVLSERRHVTLITPIPKPKTKSKQDVLTFDRTAAELETKNQQYEVAQTISGLRSRVSEWRTLQMDQWRVTPETARLLDHWRNHRFSGIRPFFCQIEAVETVIWLTEVAPQARRRGRRYLDHLDHVNGENYESLSRLALKLATGTGKTTIMAMLIAWQTINAVRRPNSQRFTRGFLIVTPGITVRDRLRVLKPDDPDSYYADRELVPVDMLRDLRQSKIVITNYHAFKLRETTKITKTGRAFLQGHGADLKTIETTGQMLHRVMPELMSMRGVIVLNDEAHHCYKAKPKDDHEGKLVGDDKNEALRNREAARLWVSGLTAVADRIGIVRTIDLSATPFFLRGSGYAEGTLFPWTMSDFSLMDAIECGIVKLPRVPVADNIPGSEVPKFRNLWEHVSKKMPKKSNIKNSMLNPLQIPVEIQTALEALYGHYEKTFELWENANIEVPPCFIVVCNNTLTSKLIYDYISGFYRQSKDGSKVLEYGRLPLFRNFDENGSPLGLPRTLLIDSTQLDSGDVLDQSFREVAADEIVRFRREIVQRTGDRNKARNLTDEDLLREVMNTVGKPDRLGGTIRCVVSVAMLTEGWDANTVTHVLGIRAFGTQLLCEQVVGRALRRQSYELNDEQRLNAEYADILGIPFDFTGEPVVTPPQPPRKTVLVKAISPDRDKCEIVFPRVAGYRVELPREALRAEFNSDSTLVLDPEDLGPSETENEGIVGQGVSLNIGRLEAKRRSTLLFYLAKHLLQTTWCDELGNPKYHLFGQLKGIAREWIDHHLVCPQGTSIAHLFSEQVLAQACHRINAGIVSAHSDQRPITAILDPYNRTGSTRSVHFVTTKETLWKTDSDLCHVNWAVCDSKWEARFCEIAERHPLTRAYVKNHGLGFEIPYRYGSETRRYVPDFIVLVETLRKEAPVYLIVEVKGYRRENAKDKKNTAEQYWVPSINRLSKYGRWDFVELGNIDTMEEDYKSKVRECVAEYTIEPYTPAQATAAKRLMTLGGSKPGIGQVPRRRRQVVE